MSSDPSSIEISPALRYFVGTLIDRSDFICWQFFERGWLMNQFNIPRSEEWSKVLSHREFEVAYLVARGFSNKKVAHELGLMEATIKVHLHNVFRKLSAKRRYDLIIAS